MATKTIEKLKASSSPFGSTSRGDRGLLALTLFFMRVHLHAVNGKTVPATHRAVYLWCSMVFLTSISGASMTTKRNVVSETISFMFMVMCSDMDNPRLGSSEPGEHYFGQLRTLIREFTTLEFSQIVEKHVRRLNLMYKNLFRPTRETTPDGYQVTFENFFDYTVDTSSPLMDGTVKIDPSGDFVAKQLWPKVKTLISYSSELMSGLLSTLRVSKEEMSPFCREFSTLEDLRDEFIRYCPHTFAYNDVHGTPSDDCDDDGASDPHADEDNGQPTEEMMLERIKRFSSVMLESREGHERGDDGVGAGGGGNLEEAATEDVPVIHSTSPVALGEKDHAELLAHFRSILAVPSADDLLDKVHLAISCLEGESSTGGAVSFARKAKSLVQRWLAKSVDEFPTRPDAVENCDILIERDTILLVNVKVGTGASASNVACHFRVITVYEKYYNKWFMAKLGFKRWKREPKPYKVSIRMLEKNALNEYSDVDLVGGSAFPKKDICQVIEDSLIQNVVGKLNHAVV